MTPASITIRVRIAGVESTRELAVIQRMKGVSVVDRDHGDCFGVDVLHAVETLCALEGWELVGYVATRAPDDGGEP